MIISNDRDMWGQYELLRPDQIERIRHRAPIAYVPWGALEWHSYHAPIGLDGHLAHGLCRALARKTGGVVLPPFYVGTDTIKPFKGFPHTVEHEAALVVSLATQVLEQLLDEQFRVLVVVTGHCGEGHTQALASAVAAVSERHAPAAVRLFTPFGPIADRYPSNHAARGETSLELLFYPGLVDPSRLPPDRVPTLDEDGVWGEDPRLASAEEGRAILHAFLEATLPVIHTLLRHPDL